MLHILAQEEAAYCSIHHNLQAHENRDHKKEEKKAQRYINVGECGEALIPQIGKEKDSDEQDCMYNHEILPPRLGDGHLFLTVKRCSLA
jgi:hypothetical protein